MGRFRYNNAKYRCEYCGLDVAVEGRWYMYDHDHLVPRKVAGALKNDPLNIVCACVICNQLKGTFDPSNRVGAPRTLAERAAYIRIVRDHIAMKRANWEERWSGDVKAILHEAGRDYRPDDDLRFWEEVPTRET